MPTQPAAPAAPKYYVIAEYACPICDGAKADCDTCNGTGVVENRVPLEDALREFEVSGSIFPRGLE